MSDPVTADPMLRAFLLDRLGLRGPLWAADMAARSAQDLGMIQIDSIRVTGLRNHEIAWAARTDAPVADFYRLLYDARGMLETHYPIFATRRDWLPWFLKDFGKTISADRLAEMRPLMRRLTRHIAEHGPVSPADFQSERVTGGFNTIKATTKALEYLFYLDKVQIAGRTTHFHRLFDLTERIAPELLRPVPEWRRKSGLFFVQSALSVLKLATPQQLAERTAHHIGSWRGGGLPMARLLVAKARERGLIVPIPFDGKEMHLALQSDIDAFASRATLEDDVVRLLPPLDNLLFSRRRLTELFGFTYKFEAYTPQHQRRFYFALPILYRDAIVGQIDIKKGGAIWQILDLDIIAPVPLDGLRGAIHRLGRIAGAGEVKSSNRLAAKWRRGLSGTISF
ncbi:DNA glycosylase AlkZ-like family protein [Dongia soli]|uniref:Crosslink repair DNA glycosylase YcaQ family protein n=1 Tax=Dongia soli TaxID=600628 RepID=A0ABU5E516_9PROT|nr:crosslink repair DNA glycosylase YcaQ family protein [Dongia soli]MDY0881410.1 crosslink repair DNA glycosylase YcaQ family protein [Dongia soli]